MTSLLSFMAQLHWADKVVQALLALLTYRQAVSLTQQVLCCSHLQPACIFYLWFFHFYNIHVAWLGDCRCFVLTYCVQIESVVTRFVFRSECRMVGTCRQVLLLQCCWCLLEIRSKIQGSYFISQLPVSFVTSCCCSVVHVVSWLIGPHKRDEQADRKVQPVVVGYNNDPIYSSVCFVC